ncbi:MAG: sodium:solute symporter [Phycisphaerales bacterium]|nr:sodium:solute symporter [Phycisphaerales bacterium]
MSNTALLIDAAIIVSYFVAITTIGLTIGRRDRNLEEYALGGRRVPWWAVMASIIAAETSAATFLGAPAEGFTTRGMTYVQLTLGLILGRVLVGYIFLKPYYDYRVYTVYDYLAIRFGERTKNYISALFLMMRVLASGVRLYVPSLVMVLAWRLFVRGEPVQYAHLASWEPYAAAIILLTAITCIYTLLGGIKAVIWTDVIQAALMFSSALIAIVTLLVHLGGGDIFAGFAAIGQYVPEMAQRNGYFLTGFESLPADADASQIFRTLLETKYTLPAALIAVTALNMAAFGTDQDMVQRMLTASDHRKSRRSLITAALMDVPIAAAFTFIGVLLIAFYAQRPELMPSKPNDVFGVYILKVMPVVVRGFVLAGVFATAMGSLSAALNALATSATNDWYIPYFGRGRDERHHVAAARVFTFVFAVLMVLVAVGFAYANARNPKLTIIPIALGIAGYMLGPMLGVFLLGMLTRARGSDRGNMYAISVGLAAVFVLSGRFFELLDWLRGRFSNSAALIAPSHPEWLPHIEFTWYVLIGALATALVGALVRTPPPVTAAAAARRAAQSSPNS